MNGRQADADGGDQPGPSRSPEDLMASLEARFARMDDVLRRLSRPVGDDGCAWCRRIAGFFSSGFFFLIVGAGLLYLAQAHIATNHAGITFVLVVLGVALLLYGTGTQGMGQFGTGGSAGYNIAIAGGAGVVAFAVAYGIIQYSTQMRDAFQPERKFVRVIVQGGDGLTDMAQYASSFDMDGIAVPAARNGRTVEVYVPYQPFEVSKPSAASDQQAVGLPDDKGMCPTTENRAAASKLDQKATTKLITAHFYRVEAGASSETLSNQAETEFLVRLDERIFRSSDGGFDYPSYPVRICVNLQQVERAKEIFAAAQRRELSAPNSGLKPNLPPALIEAQ